MWFKRWRTFWENLCRATSEGAYRRTFLGSLQENPLSLLVNLLRSLQKNILRILH